MIGFSEHDLAPGIPTEKWSFLSNVPERWPPQWYQVWQSRIPFGARASIIPILTGEAGSLFRSREARQKTAALAGLT